MLESLFNKIGNVLFYDLCGIFNNTYILITHQNQTTFCVNKLAKQHNRDSHTCVNWYFRKHFSESSYHVFFSKSKGHILNTLCISFKENIIISRCWFMKIHYTYIKITHLNLLHTHTHIYTYIYIYIKHTQIYIQIDIFNYTYIDI